MGPRRSSNRVRIVHSNYIREQCYELWGEQHHFTLRHLPVIPVPCFVERRKRLVGLTSYVVDIVGHVNPRLPDADPYARGDDVPLAMVQWVPWGEVFYLNISILQTKHGRQRLTIRIPWQSVPGVGWRRLRGVVVGVFLRPIVGESQSGRTSGIVRKGMIIGHWHTDTTWLRQLDSKCVPSTRGVRGCRRGRDDRRQVYGVQLGRLDPSVGTDGALAMGWGHGRRGAVVHGHVRRVDGDPHDVPVAGPGQSLAAHTVDLHRALAIVAPTMIF